MGTGERSRREELGCALARRIGPMGTEALSFASAADGRAPLAGEKRREVKQHVEALVASGALRRGSRVPSIIELSRALDVAKNTVIAALDELCGEGVLEARERQGF